MLLYTNGLACVICDVKLLYECAVLRSRLVV